MDESTCPNSPRIRVSTGDALPFGWRAFSLLVMSVISHMMKSASESRFRLIIVTIPGF